MHTFVQSKSFIYWYVTWHVRTCHSQKISFIAPCYVHHCNFDTSVVFYFFITEKFHDFPACYQTIHMSRMRRQKKILILFWKWNFGIKVTGYTESHFILYFFRTNFILSTFLLLDILFLYGGMIIGIFFTFVIGYISLLILFYLSVVIGYLLFYPNFLKFLTKY